MTVRSPSWAARATRALAVAEWIFRSAAIAPPPQGRRCRFTGGPVSGVRWTRRTAGRRRAQRMAAAPAWTWRPTARAGPVAATLAGLVTAQPHQAEEGWGADGATRRPDGAAGCSPFALIPIPASGVSRRPMRVLPDGQSCPLRLRSRCDGFFKISDAGGYEMPRRRSGPSQGEPWRRSVSVKASSASRSRCWDSSAPSTSRPPGIRSAARSPTHPHEGPLVGFPAGSERVLSCRNPSRCC